MGQGKSKISLEEQMKINQRAIKSAIRELDREKRQLENAERKLIADIKVNAKKGQMQSVKIMAKDLVRTRKYQSKFLEMRAQLQGVSLQLQTMKSTEAMCRAMQGCTRVMQTMNKKMDMPAINKIMQDFMRENQHMQMTEEMMGEAVDEAMDDDEDEQETLVSQVLDEIGIEMGANLGATAAGAVPAASVSASATVNANGETGAANAEEEDLESRLNALKR